MQYYINFEVLECSWKELEHAVDTAENLDHIIEAHKLFLSIVTERLMLIKEKEEVRYLFQFIDLTKWSPIFSGFTVLYQLIPGATKTVCKLHKRSEVHGCV